VAALGTFIAGRYTGTYSATDVGITEEGYTLTLEPRKILIDRSDAYGDTLIDGIYRGCRWGVEFNCKEYKAGSTGPAWPYAALGVLGVIARLDSAVAAAWVLTSTAGTPAAAAPATLTAAAAILSPTANVALLFNSDLRRVPIRLDFLAYDAGAGAIKHWVST